MLDTLKITSAGASGAVVTWLEFLPVMVRIGVGIATIIYIGIKAYKEYKK